MTILFRYILREHVKIFLMCFWGLLAIYLVIDFFEKIRRFLRYDSGVVPLIMYFALKIPAISLQIAPFAILVATLLTIGLLARSNEITAMRSCGVSLLWMTSPFLLFATVLSLFLLALSSTIVPLASEKAEEIRLINIEKRPTPLTVHTAQPWIRIGADTLMHITVVQAGSQVLQGVRLFHFDQAFHLNQIIEAAEARYTGKTWILYNGVRRSFKSNHTVDVVPFAEQPISIPLIPEDFATSLTGNFESMTFRTIRDYVARFQAAGVSFARLLTDYHSRIAFPMVTIVMVLIGIALGLRRSGVRGGGLAVGIGQAFIVSFCYWTTQSVAIALGRGGAMAPVVAGWLANIVFISFGLYLLLKVRH
ncbi:MAG: LPS export ABC transporter permease LptG [Nitrospira sp.]|nr:LPS export ABC transporter permease LptG [Nitrospira sp.]